jgi:hypothetical protein
MICSIMLILSIHRLAIAAPAPHTGRISFTPTSVTVLGGHHYEEKTDGTFVETTVPAFTNPKQLKRSRQRTGIYVKKENWWTGQYEQVELEQR